MYWNFSLMRLWCENESKLIKQSKRYTRLLSTYYGIQMFNRKALYISYKIPENVTVDQVLAH